MQRWVEALKNLYGINAAAIREIPGGWSARAFHVQSIGGEYLLKVYDDTRLGARVWIDRMDSYLPLLAFLCEREKFAGRIPRPIRTLECAYRTRLGNELLLVYRYLPGKTLGGNPMTDEQADELSILLAHVHALTPSDLPERITGLDEDISLPFCQSLINQVQTIKGAPPALADIVSPHGQMLATAAEKTMRLRDAVRLGAKNICLCHTDPHNWNLVQGDTLALLDWEGACFAPPEADLFWFAGGNQFDRILQGYIKTRPAFQLDGEMLLFYRLRRIVEDIEAFIAQWWNEDPDNALQRIIAGHIRDCCAGMRLLLADPRLNGH